MSNFKPMIGYICAKKENYIKLLTFNVSVIVGDKQLSNERIELFRLFNDKMVVPRFFIKHKFLPPKYEKINWDFGISLWPYQENIYGQILAELRQNGGCNLILKTGMGKTFIAAKIIETLGAPTLVITNNKEIMNYWSELLPSTRFFGNEKNKSNLTIGVIHTLIKQPKSFFESFKFFVFDEITEYVSAERRKIFWFPPEYILGLTATPEDRKEKERIFKLFAGPFLKFDNEKKIIWDVEIQVLKYYGPKEFTRKIISKIGYVSVVEMNKQFEQDEKRFEILVENIEKNAHFNLFIFCNTCDYARRLFEKCKSKKKYLLMGKQKSATLEEMRKDAELIFTTYSYSSKGISVDRMNGIVFAEPRRNGIIQMLGRVLRGKTSDKKKFVLDFVDAATSLSSQFYDRKKIYEKVFPEAEIKYTKIKKID